MRAYDIGWHGHFCMQVTVDPIEADLQLERPERGTPVGEDGVAEVQVIYLQ